MPERQPTSIPPNYLHTFTCAKCGDVFECEDNPCEEPTAEHHCWPCYPAAQPHPDVMGPTAHKGTPS